MKIIQKICKFIITYFYRIILFILFRVKIIGKENVPKEGGYILCSNHISNWDPLVLIAYAPRKVCFMAKKELFESCFMRFLSKLYGFFPVDRNSRDIEAMKMSLKIIKNGEVLGIFPEGTRHGFEKNGRIKNGTARIALKTGAKVIPVGIKGNYKLFRKVTVTYGKPIDFSEYKTTDKEVEKENIKKVSQIIMDSIISLTK